MLASFSHPTAGDNLPLFLCAAVVVWYRCRDKSGRVTTTGKVLLVLLLTFALWLLGR
jgi:hypothetical protein